MADKYRNGFYRDVDGALVVVGKNGAAVGGGGSGITDGEARLSSVESRRTQDEGTTLPARTFLNFTGTGVMATDDSANDQTDVTIPGGGGAPSGAAGGVLGGTYPNPSFAVDMATQAELDAVAAAKADKVEAINTVATGGTTQTLPDPSTSPVTDLTLTSATCTLTFPTATSGKAFSLLVRQDATGGRAIAWPSAVQWPGGLDPALTTTASAKDMFSFVCISGVWVGFVSGPNIS